MRWKLFVVVLTVALCVSLGVYAEPAKPDLNDVADLFSTLHSGKSVEPVRVSRTDAGFIRSVGAPPGGYLENTGAKSLDAEAAARSFLAAHTGVFANKSARLSFGSARVLKSDGRSFVRMNQTYGGVPVFSGSINVQLDGERNVTFILAGMMTDTKSLDDGTLSTNPTVSSAFALRAAIENAVGAHPGQAFKAAKTPILTIYDPVVVGNKGDAALTWQVDVMSTSGTPVEERIFINAASGSVTFKYSLTEELKFRMIFDGRDEPGTLRTLVRSEGDSACPIADANFAYQYFGDTYDFYFSRLGRDGIDDAGLTMVATVRYCPTAYECPYMNAFWSYDTEQMYFGDGFAAADDVVGHELTHGVTEFSSNLTYLNESGAINESMSDVFGEFIDQTNGAGNDSASVKWLMGEDMPIGAIRNMADPPQFHDPDRYYSSFYWTGSGDNGGVHENSGVNNKLCFLLTDGGSFDGEVITGMGIDAVAALYYEAQVHILVQSTTYSDLALSLTQAAINLNWSSADRTNLANAICAVEITPGMKPLRHFRALSNGSSDPSILLTWLNKSCGNSNVIITRKTGSFPTSPSDGTVVYTGHAESFVDGTAQKGVEYYYSIDMQAVPEFTSPMFARVISGTERASSFSEAFNGAKTSDLAFTQITFSPIYDVDAAKDSGNPVGYVNGSNYTASVTKNIYQLPVAREHAIRVYLQDETYQTVELKDTFRYFGSEVTEMFLYSNGFIALHAASQQYVTDTVDPVNDFTLASHFEIPRVSFLFDRLSPRSGGEVWTRYMDDRYVVTFDKVPEFGSLRTNTVQTELFYNGSIRITYLEINAQQSVCGLSDGLGLLPSADLSQFGTTGKVTLEPIPLQFVEAGGTLAFTAVATAPAGLPAVAFSTTDMPTGATLDAKTGKFVWATSIADTGQYIFTIKATRGAEVASQYVTVYVTDSGSVPVASELSITPEKPGVNDALVGHYTYTSPLKVPQGDSIISWYKNGAQVPQLSGQLTVPGAYVEGGSKWAFSVTPVDIEGAQGLTVVSAPVLVRKAVESDIDQDGFVDAVDIQLVINGALGIDVTPYDADVNGDGSVDSVDVQLVINSAIA